MNNEKSRQKSVDQQSVAAQADTMHADTIQTITVEKKLYHPPVVQVYGTVHVLTQSTGSGTGDSSSMMSSDITAKENIVRIGTHPLGFGLYLFDYKPRFAAQWGQGRQFGVMAQEVEPMMPSAVSMDRDGYKKVDYAVLGIRPVRH